MFGILQEQANAHVVERLDNNNYTDQELIEIKIPYPLPYSTNWKDYERFNGEIVIEGQHYNYVKRKLSNDTLYLMCIPNRERTNLNQAKNDFVNSGNGISGSSADNKSEVPGKIALKKSINTDYSQLLHDFDLSSPVEYLSRQTPKIQVALAETFVVPPFQPPRA